MSANEMRELLIAVRQDFENEVILQDVPDAPGVSLDELIADIEDRYGVEAAHEARRLVAALAAWSAAQLPRPTARPFES